MFKVCIHQLRYTFTSVKFYIALFIGCAVQIISIMPLLSYAEYLAKPLCVFESFIYFNCDTFIISAAFLGVVVLVSDVPFSAQNETYVLMRVSRRKWAGGKILYLMIVCAIYYIVSFLVGATYIADKAYISNMWSEPFYHLTKDIGREALSSHRVYFPYQHILQMTPIGAAGACFVLSVGYSFIMSLLFFLLNIKLSRILSYVGAMIVHVMNYLLVTIPIAKYSIRVSLLGNSLLMYHNINNYYPHLSYPTLLQSYALFLIAIIVLGALVLKSIMRYDFTLAVGVRQ